MKTIWKRIISLALSAGISLGGTWVWAAEPVPPEQEPLSSLDEAGRVQITVSMTEPEAGLSLIPALSFSCPAGTTAAGVLELLRQYAYLSDYLWEDGGLVLAEITENGESREYGWEGAWTLFRNGQEVSPGGSFVLEQGDTLEWAYTAESPSSQTDLPKREQAAVSTGAWSEEYAKGLAAACSWLKQNQQSHFGLMSMGAAGIAADYQVIDRLKKEIAGLDPYPSAKDAAVDALAATFCGIPATDVAGCDLMRVLSDYPDIAGEGLEPAIFALLAADSNGYEIPSDSVNTRAALRAMLLSCQNEDGGFAPAPGEPSSPLLTACALTALSAYTEEEQVRQAVSSGADYLSQHQNEDGTFPDDEGSPSVIPTSAAIIALCSMGVHMDDPRFVKQSGLMDALLSFQVNSGGFAPEAGTAAGEAATAAAVLALTAVKSGRNVFVLKTPLSVPEKSAVETEGAVQQESSESQESSETSGGAAGGWLAGAIALGLGILLAVVVFLSRRTGKTR